MTDYFALLDQRRRPWLDGEQLKETFHAKTLRAHPDAGAKDDGAFTELNEAYQVLRDPKRRLHHLLTLEGNPPSSGSASIPKEIEDLFPLVAELTHQADGLLQKFEKATSTLSRSLLKSQSIVVTKQLDEMLERLRTLYRNSESRLRECDEPNEKTTQDLQALYLQFSYLGNWISQLEEKQLSLTHLL
jgi:curved DNA-binding protein CbpA